MMRFARSGHLDRHDEVEQQRLSRAAQPATRRRFAVVGLALALPAALAIAVTRLTPAPPPPVIVEVPAPAAPEPEAPAPDPTVHDTMRAGEALGSALARHGVGPNDVADLVRDVQSVLAMRALRVGARFSVLVDSGRLERFTFHTTNGEGVPRRIDATRRPDAAPVATADATPATGARRLVSTGPRFDVSVEDATVQTTLEGLVGNVRGSLYNGVLDAGGDATLVNRFVDVFAWNVDFYRQSQPGDEFRLLVEKRFAGDGDERRFLGWGRVVAAEYVNAGTTFRGFAFETADKQFAGHFDDTGESLERTFLKSPMEVTRITSNYGSRFHPILKTQRKHEGIDYGAPLGTPIWSVADGVVTDARFSRGAGNMVVISHANGFKTEYFHMSRFADGLKAGARVKQKQIIGYVGSTGMSTGPHLHFGMFRAGSHVDPARQDFPAATPLPPHYRAEFDAFVQPLLAQLQALTRA